MFGGGGPQMTQAEMEALQAQQQQLQQLTMLKDGMRSYNRVVKECAPSRLFPCSALRCRCPRADSRGRAAASGTASPVSAGRCAPLPPLPPLPLPSS